MMCVPSVKIHHIDTHSKCSSYSSNYQPATCLGVYLLQQEWNKEKAIHDNSLIFLLLSLNISHQMWAAAPPKCVWLQFYTHSPHSVSAWPAPALWSGSMWVTTLWRSSRLCTTLPNQSRLQRVFIATTTLTARRFILMSSCRTVNASWVLLEYSRFTLIVPLQQHVKKA